MVDLGLVGRICLVRDCEESAEAIDEISDLLPGEPGLWRGCCASAADRRDGGGAFGLDFSDPVRDDGGVGAGFEGGAVTGEFAVAVCDGLP
ncbi:hypothetical protein [Frankia sp. Cppng1_Ct_nod]|uniref:hypothetical protein n=1 Tax=Frankia sp. Cppng1_Ct_nod TaxID=2897162 RepID=UPI001041703D|nr:hypothetical protein [Frankia sp. Cppng1_Ct_nod]